MTYNYEEIGKRLRKERQGKGLSEDKFAEKVNENVVYCDRGIVINWEYGRKLPSLNVLLYLCEMYDCELGYLLCEYDCKTRPKTDIAEQTGLSEESINVLLTAYKNSTHIPPAIDDGNIITALDYLLKYNYSILKDIGKYLTQKVSDIKVYGDFEQYEAGKATKSKVTKNIRPEDIEMVDVLKIQSNLADLRSDIRSGKSMPVNKLEDKTDHKESKLW